MKNYLCVILVLHSLLCTAQIPVSLPENPLENQTKFKLEHQALQISWPIAQDKQAEMVLNLSEERPLFKTIGIVDSGNFNIIAKDLNPTCILNVGTRTLKPENGWTIFFDKVPTRPYTSHVLELTKKNIKVIKDGLRTVISIGEVNAPDFKGHIEITIYNDQPLFNIAAVVSTQRDSTAILYDAALTGEKIWDTIAYQTNQDKFEKIQP